MTRKHSNSMEKDVIQRYKKGESLTKIAKSYNLYTTSVSRILDRNNIKKRSQKGNEHSQWKGGRGLKSGYWTIYAPEHPRRLNNNRVYEHIIVAEKKYGKFIPKEQPIHHIDFDRQNNHPDNLYLCENHEEHKNIHCRLEDIARELYKKGVIKFNNGKYEM